MVEAALAAGHEVTAFVRDPARVALAHGRLRVAVGDVLRPETVDRAVAGQDAVLSALGPTSNARPGTVLSEGIANVVGAMRRHGVPRLVFESGLMVADGRDMNVFKRTMLALTRRMMRPLYEDKVVAERTIAGSGLEWVIVRPPFLKHTPARGRYRVGSGIDAAIASAMAHADVADFMVRCLTDDRHVRQAIEISY